jgi:hypothetical protein
MITDSADVILAPNTSICLLRQRSELIEYLSNCCTALNPRGIMVLVETVDEPESWETYIVGFR